MTERPKAPTVHVSEDPEWDDWTRLALSNLEDAYGEDEPEYSLEMIKRPNPDYERR
jgi:hypothetical protein